MIVLLVLENDSRELDSIQVSSTDVAIRILRPYIVQILYKYGVVSEFLFLRNGICIEFEKEVVTPLNSIITVINGVNSMVIRAIKQAQHVYPALYSDYSQFSFPYNKNGYLSLQPMNVQPVPLMQQAADVPQSSVHPTQPQSSVPAQQQSLPQSLPQSLTQSLTQPPPQGSERGWEYYGNENPLQRLLREAKASGRIEELANQPITSNAELGLDDTPRDLASRNNSALRFGSYENVYSRNGSMLFPPGSRPGSMLFNPLGSNASLDFRETPNPLLEELVNRLHDGEYDDIDKGAPSL